MPLILLTNKNLTKNLTAMVAVVTAAAVEAVVAKANAIGAAAEAMAALAEREVKRAEDQHVLTVDGENTALNL